MVAFLYQKISSSLLNKINLKLFFPSNTDVEIDDTV